MEVLVAVIIQADAVDDILESFVEIGVKGATVVDSEGMGHLIPETIPIFAGLRHLIESRRNSSKTIFSVIEDEATIQKAISIVDKIVGGLDKPDTGFLFTIPVTRVMGLPQDR